MIVAQVTSSSPWRVTVMLEGAEQEFTLDTGTNMTAVPDRLVPKNISEGNKETSGAKAI